MQRLHIHGRLRRDARIGAEDRSGAVKQLRLPLRDLVRVNIELLRQFAQRLVPLRLMAAKATFALNAGV